MKYKKWIQYIKHFFISTKGNTLLLMVASAIAATMGIFFFASLTTLDRESKERVTHLYNAYQMGQAVNKLIENRLFTRGQLEIDFQDSNGNYKYTESEFVVHIQFEDNTVLNLKQMVHDDMITDADDPTATRMRFESTSYDKINSTVLIQFDMVVDSYDSDGNVVKKVGGINYLVNLAGYEVPEYADTTNAPYSSGMPFYYIVSYADENAGLTESDITLKVDDVKFKGVLDTSTLGNGPQPDIVVILPGENDS